MEHYRMAIPGRVSGAIARRRYQPYRYSTLSTPTAIRVVVVGPRTSDCLIHCTIKEVDLNLDHAFEALSYTWAMDRDFGPPRVGEVRTIICDGQAFDAQRNLYNALIQLQELRRTLPVWIDAICINQTDLPEKTAQVNMMGDIYRAAKLVIVWLGRATLVAQVARRAARGFFGDDWIARQGHVARRADVPMPSIGRLISLSRHVLLPITALAWILERGWFSRVWTAQEIVLAEKTTYLIGSHEIRLDELVRSTIAIKQAWESLEDGLAFSIRQMLDGARFIANAREKSTCTLEEAMQVSRLRHATNPRDKVFAMLGFCDTPISADYGKSVRQVYCEFAVAVLRSETSFYLLSLVGQVRQESGPQCEYRFAEQAWSNRLRQSDPIRDLPSWVPDLHFPTEPTPLRDTVDVSFAAATSQNIGFAVDEVNWMLQVSARSVGIITGLGHTLECARHGHPSYLQPAWDYLHLPAGFGPTYPPTGEPTLSAFWKTLAAGSEKSAREGRKSVKVNSKHFVEWFTLMSEEGGHIHPAEMRKRILGFDGEHQTGPMIEAAEIEQRRHRKYVFTSTLRLTDVQKAAAIRHFVDALDNPAHGLRQRILQRDNDRAQLKSEPKDGGGGPEPLFEGVYQRNFADRRFFAIGTAYFGLAPWTAQVGDVVMLIAGAYVPFVFRRADIVGRWRLVGEAYCHGVMFGEESSDTQQFNPITIV